MALATITLMASGPRPTPQADRLQGERCAFTAAMVAMEYRDQYGLTSIHEDDTIGQCEQLVRSHRKLHRVDILEACNTFLNTEECN